MLLVFGSVNVDTVFNLKRLPTPGETLLTPHHTHFSGGKGANQAVAAARVNIPTSFFGSVGNDPSGMYLKDKLSKESLELHLFESEKMPTGSAFICVDENGENFITVSQGANNHLQADHVSDHDLQRSEVVLLQMEVSADENLKLAKRAQGFGKQVILNYAPAVAVRRDLIQCCNVLIVNQHELRLVASSYGLLDESLEDLVRSLEEVLCLTVITTLGSDGVIVAKNGEIEKCPAFKVRPLDTTGAGDAFVGCFAGFVSEGLPMIQAIERAMIAAGLSCTKHGTQESYCYLDELQRHIR